MAIVRNNNDRATITSGYEYNNPQTPIRGDYGSSFDPRFLSDLEIGDDVNKINLISQPTDSNFYNTTYAESAYEDMLKVTDTSKLPQKWCAIEEYVDNKLAFSPCFYSNDAAKYVIQRTGSVAAGALYKINYDSDTNVLEFVCVITPHNFIELEDNCWYTIALFNITKDLDYSDNIYVFKADVPFYVNYNGIIVDIKEN